MAKNPYAKYAEAVASREQGLRGGLKNVFNTVGEAEDIALATGAGGPINLYEVPAIAGLASMKAYVDTKSQAREEEARRKIGDLPDYVKSRQQYLRWRYPSRYGMGGSSEDPYLTPTEISEIEIPGLPAISGFPRRS